MPRNQLAISSGFYISEATGLVNRRLSNMYPVYPEAESANRAGLVGTPGIDDLSEVPSGPSRGVLVFNDGTPYRVIGGFLYSIASDGSFINIGAISGFSDVSMSTNGINIAIQDPSGSSYFYTPSTNTLELNNGADFLSFGQAKTVTFKDGYYVYSTLEIFFSGSFKETNDGKDFNPLDFEDAEIAPDSIIKLWNNHNQLYVMGQRTIEVYQTVVTSGFPFQRSTNAVIQKGCIAPNSVTDFDDGFTFIGGDQGEKPGIWKGVGSSFFKISDASIDNLIHKSSVSELVNARAWTYAENGAYFAVFTVGQNTVVYDATASRAKGVPQWHARQTGIGNGKTFTLGALVMASSLTVSFRLQMIGPVRSA